MAAALSPTPIVLSGPLRAPAQMLAEQQYGGHASVHDAASAQKLGLAGAPIEGPTHFTQFEPLALAVWGERWFTHGCISAHFQTMVVEGEQVRAELELPGPGASAGRIRAFKADGTPVLEGTASVGPRHGPTALEARLDEARGRPAGTLHIIDLIPLGPVAATDAEPETACVDFDNHLGPLYPFTLAAKLERMTEHLAAHQRGAATPWGGAVMPFEMLSVLAYSGSQRTGPMARQPSVGLFIDLEVKLLAGPVRVGRPYRLQREVLALGQSKRVESWWTRTTLLDAGAPVAEVLLHQGVFKASYPHYPSDTAGAAASAPSAAR